MNITLLILGVFLILISTILIAVNSSNSKDESSKYQNKQQPETDNLNTKYQKEPPVKQKQQAVYQEKEINPIKYVTHAEDEILLRDINKEESPEIIDLKEKPTNITDEIIHLHKEGLSVSQIAARLEKGIREIEIILKVNKLKD